MSELQRLPPHSIDAEFAVLGSLLIDPDAIYDVAAFLQPQAFYNRKNRHIYDAVLTLNERQDPVDLLTLAELLRQRGQLEDIGGEPYLIDLLSAVPTSINARHYGRLVEAGHIRRNLLSAASTIAELAYDEQQDTDVVLERAEQALFAISEERTTRDLTPLKHVASQLLEEIERRRELGSGLSGIPTGFADIDRLLSGLNKSDLLVVAARPGMGKTAFIMNLALTAARRYQKCVAIFNLEMSAEQLLQRMVSAETQINAQRLRRGDIHPNEEAVLYEALGRLAEAPIYIDDTPGMTPRQMRTKCRRLHAERGLDLVVVDYLQLMQADSTSNNRVQEISEISRGLKLLARELNVPVVAAAQLSRAVESRQDKRPMLSDLRDSGSIEQDSDVVMFIYRDEYYNPETTERPNIAEISISKHRNGPTGTVDLYWHAQLATFKNLQRQEINL